MGWAGSSSPGKAQGFVQHHTAHVQARGKEPAMSLGGPSLITRTYSFTYSSLGQLTPLHSVHSGQCHSSPLHSTTLFLCYYPTTIY